MDLIEIINDQEYIARTDALILQISDLNDRIFAMELELKIYSRKNYRLKAQTSIQNKLKFKINHLKDVQNSLIEEMLEITESDCALSILVAKSFKK